MDQKKIGNYISKKRHEQGFTQKTLAEAIGVTDKAVSKWERGICLPNIEFIPQLSNLLGIGINELLAGEDMQRVHIEDKYIVDVVETYSDQNSNKLRKKYVAFIIILLIASFAFSFAQMHFSSNRNNPDAQNAFSEVRTAAIELLDVTKAIQNNQYSVDVISLCDLERTLNISLDKITSFELKTRNDEKMKELSQEVEKILRRKMEKIDVAAYTFYEKNYGDKEYICTLEEMTLIDETLTELPAVIDKLTEEMGIKAPKLEPVYHS